MKKADCSWEAAYQRKPTGSYGRPGLHRPIVEPLPGFFAARDVKKVLDIGCGDGVHLHFFADAGFDVFGLDYAPTALRLAQEWLEGEGLSCEVRCGLMTSIPWDDGVFGAVISTNALDHNDLASIRTTTSEVHRVIRAGGYFFANVLRYPGAAEWPPEAMRQREPEEVEERTLVPSLGHDAGVPHHWFTETELHDILGQFRVIELKTDAKFTFLVQKQ